MQVWYVEMDEKSDRIQAHEIEVGIVLITYCMTIKSIKTISSYQICNQFLSDLRCLPDPRLGFELHLWNSPQVTLKVFSW